MWSIFNLMSLWLISENLESVYGTHAKIGNYNDLNPKDCGISRLSIGFSDVCFEWHKNPLSLLKHVKDSTVGEVPWMTFVEQFKGKIYNKNDYHVTLGGDAVYPTPSLAKKNVSKVHFSPDPGLDLLLLKLARPISPNIKLPIKSICLPEPNISPIVPEYAMNAGWGNSTFQISPVPIGYKKIITEYDDMPLENIPWPNYTLTNYLFTVLEKEDENVNCKGDSGGPLWQYDKGRAVLIGVTSFTLYPKENQTHDCNEMGSGGQYTGFIKVSSVIDWIQNVTGLQ